MKKDMRNEYIKQIRKEIQSCQDIDPLDLVYRLLKKAKETEKQPSKKWLY